MPILATNPITGLFISGYMQCKENNVIMISPFMKISLCLYILRLSGSFFAILKTIFICMCSNWISSWYRIHSKILVLLRWYDAQRNPRFFINIFTEFSYLPFPYDKKLIKKIKVKIEHEETIFQQNVLILVSVRAE